MNPKARLIERILETLRDEIQAIERSAKAAHEAATHEESKAEDQHDTRGLEASYLAGAQAGRIAELTSTLAMFKFLVARDFKPTEPIGVGALVQLECDRKVSHYFLVAQGGGISIHLEGKTFHVITPQAPLGDALLGKRAGEAVEVEAKAATREYEILSVE